ncbi:hypothetical protein [Pseudomonas sp. KCJK8993]|uniref:hypothetical protein n=1 Tax=Pseudomonas sp. KCJK8993 TaxID=3344565 RepID=UPI003905DF33
MSGAACAEGVPLSDVACPGNLAVGADQDGPVSINGKTMQSSAEDDRHFQARTPQASLSISVEDNESVTVKYSARHSPHLVGEAIDD